MHDTALEIGELFFKTYVGDRDLTIVEIGSQDIYGSLRSVSPQRAKYIGVDFVEGKGVDVILDDPYTLPFESDSIEVCICSSCFEHSEFFWLLFNEIQRILKPGGIFYLNVPSNGGFHRWPVDCWRFYPDSGKALQNWARRSGHDTVLLESFTGKQRAQRWNDFVAVFLKGSDHLPLYPSRIQERYDRYTNGLTHGSDRFSNLAQYPEDQARARTDPDPSPQGVQAAPFKKRLGRLLANLPAYLRLFGLRGMLDFARIRYAVHGTRPLPLHLRGHSQPLWLRPGSTDVGTMREIFIARDYELGLSGDSRTIVDAGANIGLSTVFFAQNFPHARIVAIEPEWENFRLLERNTRGYPNVTPLHAALWSHSGQVSLINPGRGEHGFTTASLDEQQENLGTVPAIEMRDLMKRFHFDRVDIFKVDIEGSEKEVFEASEPWISQVQTVVAELHDHFKPGCQAAFSHATRHMPTTAYKGKLVMKGPA